MIVIETVAITYLIRATKYDKSTSNIIRIEALTRFSGTLLKPNPNAIN